MQHSSSFFWASDSNRLDAPAPFPEEAEEQDVGLFLDDEEDNGSNDDVLQDEETPLVPPPDLYQQASGMNRLLYTHPEVNTSGDSDGYGGFSPSPPVVRRKSRNPFVLRFQVVLWHVGQVDVIQGHVSMRFRVTLFWNDLSKRGKHRHQMPKSPTRKLEPGEWTMKGRQRACRHDINDEANILETVDVPPVSILNAVTFDTLGEAEITMLDENTRLMRWTCMYNANLFQGDHLEVNNFPHDVHDLQLRLGVLAERGIGGRWDRSQYQLALATEDDSQGSTKIPHGLVVDHVTIPDFFYDPSQLKFDFVEMRNFGGKTLQKHSEHYLQVHLRVYRLSAHYDRSIMPILTLLNIIAITCLPRNFSSATASTETMLSIAFVQVGIRLTIDSRLPSVGYTIKMQSVLNQCFWLICLLVFESNLVFFLVTKREWEIQQTDRMDVAVAAIALGHTIYISRYYYTGRSPYHQKRK